MNIICLNGKNSSFIISCNDKNPPQCIYWGEKLQLNQDEIKQLLAQNSAIPQGTIDEPSHGSLIPSLAQGDFHINAIEIISSTHWSPNFELINTKLSSQSAKLTLKDDIAKLSIEINISIDNNDILQKNIKLTNLSDEKIIVSKLLNTLTLPNTINEITQYHGRWIQEAQEQTSHWDQPNYIVENIRGRSSHDNPPILRLQETGSNNNAGNCYGFSLAWSGNHSYILRKLDDGNKVVQWGEKLISDEISLEKNQSYTTPTLLATFSSKGFNSLRHNWHNFIRKDNNLAIHTNKYRPIQINTWEAVYFEHDIDTFKKMIDKSADLGIERFVLDDGWFNGRNNDRVGLGDWFVDRAKYPQGLHPLVDYTISKGLEFGLWFEPEMFNPDSNLYRKHPDWALQINGYKQKLGRYQYVLNLTNPQAFKYILKCMQDILSEYQVSYVKWDMNRDLIQAGGTNGKACYHDQVLATHKLLGELKKLFPNIEFESCSSGGARTDFKILEHTNRFWSSDCNDPLERQNIHKGLSQFFPPEMLGAHVGPTEAHTTSRLNKLEYSLITCFAGHLGFERNVIELNNNESEVVKKHTKLYKKYRSLLHNSKQYYLDTNNSSSAQTFISDDRSQALLMYCQNTMPENMLPQKLKILGLNASKTYCLKMLNEIDNVGYVMKALPSLCNSDIRLTGNILANIGLDIPLLHPQSAILVEINEVKND
ncbi:alpha-galactosidase [Francisella sp. Scap27]|uniref:alpha-galactosidase n=1 Tax=Francisella sp. Scap27 TaxID=2589986 RepID=UPI0015C04C9F|nr:alpha-galactosidase [Francisella sp. Scap27]QLE78899.1 alpha-galactosidase [Francisella sp. Scap27]